MPKLTCTVTKCGHNEDKLCSLNSIEISGGESKENTCCNNFTHEHYATNSSHSASPTTHIFCQAKDCVYNDDCICVAESIDVKNCTSDDECSCKDTKCNTFKKKNY